MHGCLKRRFETYQNASKILLGGKFKIMLKTSQICCLWSDSNSLIKKRHFFYSVDRKMSTTTQTREICDWTVHI